MNVKVNINELTYILDHTPPSQNVMLSGPHGVGKSEFLRNYYASRGRRVIQLFLGQMSDTGDLIGLPERVDGRSRFALPWWFPHDDKPVVLFLDELNRAHPEMLQAVMDLALNRTIAGRPLPAGSRIVAAVNEGDRYQLTDLDPALVSRFNVYEVAPTVLEWLLWGEANCIDERVLKFIRKYNQWLDGVPGRALSDIDKMPDRRAWTNVSACITDVKQLDRYAIKLIAGMVGGAAAAAFVQFIEDEVQISARQLLSDFEAHRPEVEQYGLHDFAVLNDAIFTYLENNRLEGDAATRAAANLRAYVDMFKQPGKIEYLSNFVSHVTDSHFCEATGFIMVHCPELMTDLMSYVMNAGFGHENVTPDE